MFRLWILAILRELWAFLTYTASLATYTVSSWLYTSLYVCYNVKTLSLNNYEGVSKSFETSPIDRQPMAVCECVRCAWEQGLLPLSMPSGVAVWALKVAQHECLSPRVPSHLRFQHGRETGADSKHQILRETRQIWSGDFWNDMTCIWKWGHESCEVFQVARALQERHNITRRRQVVRATFHELNI